MSSSPSIYPQNLSKSKLTGITAVSPPDRRPIVISGPSGVGKGTLAQKLLDSHPDPFAFTVSHTTRKPRGHEVEGVAYFFVSPSEFSSLVSENVFVEHTFFSGNYYGTSKQTIAEKSASGLVVVLDIDMNGVKQIKANSTINARYVFLKPPSFETLEARLRSRRTENEEETQERLIQIRAELEYANEPGIADKIIVNDNLETAFAELEEFVYRPGA